MTSHNAREPVEAMPALFLKVAADIAAEIPLMPTVKYPSVTRAISKAIHDAVMAERGRDQWRDIRTAPKDGTAVDLWGINHLHHAKTGRRATDVTWGRVRDWMGNERDDWQHGRGEDFEPTHWMPRTAPPKTGD